MISDLASLAAPLGEDVLLEHVAIRRPLYVRTHDPDRGRRLLSLDLFEDLIARGTLGEKRLELYLNGVLLPRRLYRGPAGGAPPLEALRKLWAQGVSAVIGQIDRDVPTIQNLTRALAARLGGPTLAKSYLSCGSAPALGAHCDGHDVIVLQCQGAKRWRLYGPSAEPVAPQGHAAAMDGRAPLSEETLHPGDVLYLPKGEIHAAVPVHTPSLHLSIGIDVPPKS